MTTVKWRKPGQWLAIIPPCDILRKRIAELQEELRQLSIILKTAELLEADQTENETTKPSPVTGAMDKN